MTVAGRAGGWFLPARPLASRREVSMDTEDDLIEALTHLSVLPHSDVRTMRCDRLLDRLLECRE